MTSTSKFVREGRAKVHAFCRGIMRDRRARLAEAGSGSTHAEDFLKRRKTLLDVLLDAQMEGKYEIDDKAILDEIVTFIGAAVETSASTLASVMKVLSLYPDVQEKAHAEVMQVLGGSKRSVSLADLSR